MMTAQTHQCFGRFWLFLFLLCQGAAAFAQEPERILNAAYINFPPIAYTDASGQAAGEIIDLTNSLAKACGLRLQWRELPANRVRHHLRSGEVDMWPASRASSTLDGFVIETNPLDITVQLRAYYLNDLPEPATAATLQDRKLILIRGYTYRDQLERWLEGNNHAPLVAPDHVAALELLRRGRGDVLISFSHPVEQIVENDPLPELNSELLDEWQLTLLISRRTEGAESIVEALNATIADHHRTREKARKY
jgi:polar amino acid transport system substrate-binding protein